MFLNIKEMEVRRIQFDESFETGEIDFADTGLRQITPIHAVGSATLLDNTGGEIRVQGRYTCTLEADCDRCLALTRILLEKSFDLFYRPPPDLDVDEIKIEQGAGEIAFYEGLEPRLPHVTKKQSLATLRRQRIY